MEQAGGADPDDFTALDEVVKEFVQYDPGSFSFRYPTDKEGNSLQAGIPSLINLKNLNDVMTRVANFLDASCEYVGQYLDIRAEMMAEYADFDR